MYSVLKGVVVIIGIFLLVSIILGNYDDTVLIKEELSIDAPISEVSSYLTEMDKFINWYPDVDSIYRDSLDAGIWVIENEYRDKLIKTNLRVQADSASIYYKMWTGAYNSRTDIILKARDNTSTLTSRTTISGETVILAGINKLNYFSARKKIRAGFQNLKMILEAY